MSGLLFGGLWIAVVLYLAGLAMSKNTDNEDELEDSHFEQDWLDKPQTLTCLSCEFKYLSSPDREPPLWCPRCGIPLVTED